MRVKVANAVTLPVKFVGFIVLRIAAGDVCNGNCDYSNFYPGKRCLSCATHSMCLDSALTSLD
eukprot:2913103-Pleurochrysis_carterae.AAC.1